MGRKMGKPWKASKFICLKCLRHDMNTGEGIQRIHEARKDNHVKDIWCCNCKERTKSLEVRQKDNLDKKMKVAALKRDDFYDYINGEYVLKEKYVKEMSHML